MPREYGLVDPFITIPAANAAQTIPDNFNFRIELRLIIQLLKVTAAAAAKVGARRRDANR